jgi:hypothetical protein
VSSSLWRAIAVDSHYEPAQQNIRRIFELFHFGASNEPFILANKRPVSGAGSGHQLLTSSYQHMRTTIILDKDIFEAARALAASSGKKLGQVISQLARRGLRSQPEAAAKNGLPIFRVSADAAVIPTDRARDLLADEGL